MAAVPDVADGGLNEVRRSRGRRRIGVLKPGGELFGKFREGFRRVAGRNSSISFGFKNVPRHSAAGPRLTGHRAGCSGIAFAPHEGDFLPEGRENLQIIGRKAY